LQCRAFSTRCQFPALQDNEAYTEFRLLAAHYERLAQFIDSSGLLGSANAAAASSG